MNQHIGAEAGALIPKPDLARELGVCGRTLSRWMADPAMDFPPSIVIRGRHYFERVSFEGWKAARLRAALKGDVASRRISGPAGEEAQA